MEDCQTLVEGEEGHLSWEAAAAEQVQRMMVVEGAEGALMMEPLAGEVEEAVVDLMEEVEARHLGVQSNCNSSPLKDRIREQLMEERVVQGAAAAVELL